ncbi:flippase [Paenibacillus abyssi]|uniref:Flippase n=1 Tax=Paenibacillus abyssi TaxID=1340531 RepID=A0A917CW08_9BACL|nr:flippase [Paenibacillus abyssi]GGF98571.1 flippase [Paenibacillus abyssi]
MSIEGATHLKVPHHKAGQRPAVSKVLARGGSISFLINTTGMGLALLLQIILARVLGVTSYGIYAFVTTVITFLVFPAKLGFDTAIVRLIASYRVHGAWSSIKGLLRRSNQITCALSLLISAAGLIMLWIRSSVMSSEQTAAYAAGLASIPLLTLATLRQSALQAIKDVLFAQMPEKILRPVLTIGLLLLCIYGFGMNAGAGVAMACFAAAVLVTYVLGAFVLRYRIGPETAGLEPQYETRRWMAVSLSLMINAGMYLILGQLNVLMMGVMHGSTESGIFSAAVRLAALVSFALTAINMTAAPLLSEMFAKGDTKQLRQVSVLSGRAGFAFAAVVSALFAVLGRWILGLFGEEFQAAYPALLILAAGQLFSAYCGQNGTLATMTGHQGMLTKALMAATVLNIVLNIALIPLLGMTGAALAATCSVIGWNTAMVIVIKRKLGIVTLAWIPKRKSRSGPI